MVYSTPIFSRRHRMSLATANMAACAYIPQGGTVPLYISLLLSDKLNANLNEGNGDANAHMDQQPEQML